MISYDKSIEKSLNSHNIELHESYDIHEVFQKEELSKEELEELIKELDNYRDHAKSPSAKRDIELDQMDVTELLSFYEKENKRDEMFNEVRKEMRARRFKREAIKQEKINKAIKTGLITIGAVAATIATVRIVQGAQALGLVENSHVFDQANITIENGGGESFIHNFDQVISDNENRYGDINMLLYSLRVNGDFKRADELLEKMGYDHFYQYLEDINMKGPEWAEMCREALKEDAKNTSVGMSK